MKSPRLLSDKHLLSQRTAVFEDDGTSAWLYLTAPRGNKPVADCWVYNRIPPPDPASIRSYQGGPPPACQGYADLEGTVGPEYFAMVKFVWASDGNAVSVWVGDQALGFIAGASLQGYSRFLLRDGPWGNVWDQALYDTSFPLGL